MHILDQIVAQKRIEITDLYQQHSLAVLKETVVPTQWDFYQAIADARAAERPFFILEFKRKSPSEGWIQEGAEVAPQILAYGKAGAGAISVLTDSHFFGGSYEDLRVARATLDQSDDYGAGTVLLLQKDFVLDPIQIYLAREAGADLILLIAAILDADVLEQLRQTAESLGMGVLVEVHDQAELDKVQHLDFPVLGINNRDLKTFRTSLNRVNVLAQQAKGRWVVSESGIHDYRDFRVVQGADGFLVGTSLMRQIGTAADVPPPSEAAQSGTPSFFQQKGGLLKACGIRVADHLRENLADFVGINFSPVSKRRIDPAILAHTPIPSNAVAVFYQNTEEDILAILEQYPFRRVQLYAGDVSPDFVRTIRRKVILAAKISHPDDCTNLLQYAADIDFFILDGAAPGSGQAIQADLIPKDFPYPFLLAGGIDAENAVNFRLYSHCFGVDVASGIETAGQIDPIRIEAIQAAIR